MSILRLPVTWMLLGLAGLIAASRAVAADPPEDSAVGTGKEALAGVGSIPWYDKRQDEVRPLHLVPRDSADSDNRNSTWTSQDTSTATTGGSSTRISLLGGALQWVGL